MKTLNMIIVGLMTIGLTACGNQNNNPNLNGAYGYNGQQAGYGVTQGGCVPIQSGALGFTAQGAQMNSAIILAGTLPQNSTRPGVYGQVTMGSSGVMQQGMIQYAPKMSSSGTLQISVAAQGGTMTGVIQLSQSIVYQLMAMTGGGGYYPGQQQSSACVSSVSLDIVHTANMSGGYYPGQQMGTGFINQALVYLTLGSGQSIGPIPFY